MKNHILWAFATVAGLLSSCAEAPLATPPEAKIPPPPEVKTEYERPNLVRQKIDGQVFIVTRGQEAVKLALTTVRVYPLSYTQYLRSLQFDYQKKVLVACESAQYDAGRTLIWVGGAADTIWHLGELAIPIAEAKTDADGKFEIDAPLPRQWVLVAEQERRVFDETEHYRWVVDSAHTPDPSRVFLSNDNLDPQ